MRGAYLLAALVILYALWHLDCFGAPLGQYLPIVDRCAPLQRQRRRRPQLFCTYMAIEKVPQKVWGGLARFAPEYDIRFFDDDACERYLGEHFDPAVLRRYKHMEKGAHRADLWRYCVLYREGGLYMDIKTVLLRPLSEIIPRERNATVLSIMNGTVYQGILHVPRPGSPVLRRCIAHCLQTKQRLLNTVVLGSVWSGWGYLAFTHFMHDSIAASVGERRLVPGVNGAGDDAWVLFEERCTPDGCATPDRYGMCCSIFAAGGQPVFRTRYADFPW